MGGAHHRRREQTAEASCRSHRKTDGITAREDGEGEGCNRAEREEREEEKTVQVQTRDMVSLPPHRRGAQKRRGVLLLTAFSFVAALSLSRSVERLGSMTNKETDVSDETDNLTLTTKLGFPWDLIDPSIDGLCGLYKCFFRHVSSRDGFIVSYTTGDSEKGGAEDQVLGWERGIALEREYGLKQPYYEEHPPQKIDIRGPVADDVRNIMKLQRNNTIAPHLFIGIVYGEEEDGTPIQRPNSTLPEDTPNAYSLEVTQVRYIHQPHLEYVRLSCCISIAFD